MKTVLQKLAECRDLSRAEMTAMFDRIMDGDVTAAPLGAMLMGLRLKGETAEELAGAAESMRRHAIRVDAGGPSVDTCGTGGDGLHTFNISTAAAFVTAGAGVTVAKHGNRAVTSRCGSADVLAELGVNVEAPPEQVEECLRSVGIGFLFAQRLHPAMKHAAGPRRELGIRTIFNMLGPLTNPAGARGQVLGVFAPELTETFARVLQTLGCRRAWVVHGSDGMDEITVTGPTRVTQLLDGGLKTFAFEPQRALDREPASLADLAGGDPRENAAIIRGILEGRDQGPRRDVVLLNAAAGIWAGERADSFPEALVLARQSLESGRAAGKLDGLIRESR